MKILLLGAGGQLGHELLPLLAARGELVAPPRAALDTSDTSALKTALDRIAPQLVINGTAYNEVDKAESDVAGAQRLNAEAVAIMGDYASARGAALIHYSTDFVFDGRASAPYVETDTPNPLSAYGRSKLAGEKALSEAPAIILRTAWLYSLRRKSFVSAILKLAREREELSVVSDQVGNPTWCRDLARVTARIVDRLAADPHTLAHEHRGVYHATGRGHCSRYELATAAIELDPAKEQHKAKRVLPVTADRFPAPAARPAYAPLDCTKLEQRFGVAFLPWKDALREALNSSAEAPDR
jgi:dTDP-4-dehydrorhamnose reductase